MTLLGVCSDTQNVYIISELMNGGSLSNLIENHSLNWNAKIDIIHNIISALADMHSRKPPIIHRDIKPENILILNNNNELIAKLTDFGISKTLQETSAKTQIGTYVILFYHLLFYFILFYFIFK